MSATSHKVLSKWLASLAVSLGMTVLLLECTLPFLDARFEGFFRFPDFQATLSDANDFLKSPRFDPTLGWASRPPVHNLDTTKLPVAQAYGDSFVLSGHDSGRTWESAFEVITGKVVLNYGEGGYGLDQAVLKFERYRDARPAQIAILGLYSEEMRRARAYYSYYYFARKASWRYAFKPFFAPDGRSFRLVSPPCIDAKCLVEAVAGRNTAVNGVLEQYDYWFQFDRARPALAFPRSWSYARAFSHAIAERRRVKESESVFVDAVAADLAEYLIRRFADGARRAGMVPVCLLLYSADELAQMKRGVRQDERLRAFLDREGIVAVDTGPYILQSLPLEKTFKRITVPDGHMNREGDRLIAEALAQSLGRLGLL